MFSDRVSDRCSGHISHRLAQLCVRSASRLVTIIMKRLLRFAKAGGWLALLALAALAVWTLAERRVSSLRFVRSQFFELTGEEDESNCARSNKIFCLVLTQPDFLATKGLAAYETWARHCDGYRLVSVAPGSPVELVDVDIEVQGRRLAVLKPTGLVAERYDRLTDKVFSSFREIYKHYGGYDWYLKADDDTFVFVDHLRRFVHDRPVPCRPQAFGFELASTFHRWLSGGAGYLMSRAAFRRLGAKLSEDRAFCPNSGTEDLDVSRCLRSLGVAIGRSVDAQERERFHPSNIHSHVDGSLPDWLFSYARYGLRKGLACCSDSTISFHYMHPGDMYKLSGLVEELRARHAATNASLAFQELLETNFHSILSDMMPPDS